MLSHCTVTCYARMISSQVPPLCKFIRPVYKDKLFSQLESHETSYSFVIFKNKVATTVFSRKDEMEKEEKVTPHLFLFALKLLVTQEDMESSVL